MIHHLTQKSDEALAFALNDLNEVISIQEKDAANGGNCPKLGEYHDDRFAVLDELRHRAARAAGRRRASRHAI